MSSEGTRTEASPVALVTGGAKRLGRHLAEQLAARGYRVVINFRASERAAADAVAGIQARGGAARALQADIADKASVAEMFASVADVEGRLDLLVNNVGNYDPQPLRHVTPEAWDDCMAANLSGAFYCCYHARPLLERAGGQIVNIGYAGVDALVANAAATPYQVTKTGLLVLTKSLAVSMAPHVRVNMISPGQLDNSIDLPSDIPGTIPLQRAGHLEDVAQTLAFLLDADYVTGTNIDVAGGYRLSGS